MTKITISTYVIINVKFVRRISIHKKSVKQKNVK